MHLRPVALLIAMLAGFLLLAPATATADETPSPSPSASTSADPQQPSTPPESGSYIAVTLLDSSKKSPANDNRGEPVPGVTLNVESGDGTEVGSAVTGPEGQAFIPIPGNGPYTVVLDEGSLPDGVELSGDAATEKKVNALLEGATNVQYQIGVTESAGVSKGAELSNALVKGIKLGLLISLAGLGLSLIFGTTGLTNFAHGELVTFGAIIGYVFNRGIGLPVVLAGVCAVVAAGLFGYVQDKGLWGPLRHRGTGLIAMMIVSIGLAILMRYLFQYGFGGSTRTYSQYVAQSPNEWGPIRIADKEIAIIVICVVALAVTITALARTRLGKAMRAVSDNPALSASSGMRVDGVITSVWVLGTAITGLAGFLLAVDRQAQFQLGFKLLLLVFAAVTLGGLGTIWGAVVGGIIIGIIDEVGPVFGVPASIKDVGPLLVLILILLVRPQGILGRRQRIG